MLGGSIKVVVGRVMRHSKWEKQLLKGILGKFKKTTARFFPLYENYLQRRSFETHCQQPASLNWGGERKGSLTYMKWVFSRQAIVGKGERRRGRKWRFVYDITEKVFHMRSAYEHSSHWLMPGRQRETSRNPSDVKALTHADYCGGHPPLSLITGCQGEHSLHMCLLLLLLLLRGVGDPHASDKKEICAFWQVSGAMSAVKCNEWPNWNRSQQAGDRSTDKQKAEETETHGRQTWTQIVVYTVYCSLIVLMQCELTWQKHLCCKYWYLYCMWNTHTNINSTV